MISSRPHLESGGNNCIVSTVAVIVFVQPFQQVTFQQVECQDPVDQFNFDYN